MFLLWWNYSFLGGCQYDSKSKRLRNIVLFYRKNVIISSRSAIILNCLNVGKPNHPSLSTAQSTHFLSCCLMMGFSIWQCPAKIICYITISVSLLCSIFTELSFHRSTVKVCILLCVCAVVSCFVSILYYS